ncbi:MAG TPA: hypothetical protein VK308_02045, partial [Pyrinomonadaceae bacterium]|nr:hypothetical protein [Pyrinomonadaceae bacterium]
MAKYLLRILSAISLLIAFEGTLTSAPSRRNSSIKRFVSCLSSFAKSYTRILVPVSTISGFTGNLIDSVFLTFSSLESKSESDILSFNFEVSCFVCHSSSIRVSFNFADLNRKLKSACSRVARISLAVLNLCSGFFCKAFTTIFLNSSGMSEGK